MRQNDALTSARVVDSFGPASMLRGPAMFQDGSAGRLVYPAWAGVLWPGRSCSERAMTWVGGLPAPSETGRWRITVAGGMPCGRSVWSDGPPAADHRGATVTEPVTVERDGYVLLIGVGRPAKRNAFNLAVIEALGRAYEILAAMTSCAPVCCSCTGITSRRAWTWLRSARQWPSTARGCCAARTASIRSGSGAIRCPSRW
jgi:hypothetical protein